MKWHGLALLFIAGEALFTSSFASANGRQLYLSGCEILNSEFKTVRTIPGGNICQIFADGSWISSNEKVLRFWNKGGEQLWSSEGIYTHQIREDEDGNILLLKEEHGFFAGISIAFDIIEKRSKSGALIASWSFKDHAIDLAKINQRKGKKKKLLYILPKDPQIAEEKAEPYILEFSHVNSIQAVPKSRRGFIGGAAYLIHDPILGSCMGLSEDMQKILWSAPLPDGGEAYSVKHDCQLTENGDLLYFDNFGKKWKSGYSYEVFLRDQKGRPKFSFPKSPKDFKLCPFRGGVEMMNGRFFISTTERDAVHAIWVDKAGNLESEVSLPGRGMQEIKTIQWSDFLENNMVR